MAAEDDRQQYELQRKCWRKKAYSTAKLAHKEARRIYKKTGIRLYTYQCSGCGQVHLTKNILGKGKVL